MNGPTLLIKNLTRNRLRTVLTVLAIALPMFVFTVARSFVDLVNDYLRQMDKNMRVCVHQRLTYTAELPARIRGEIEQLAPPGYVASVCCFTWFGGKIEGQKAAFPSAAIDRDTFAQTYPEFGMTPDEIERFRSERRGAVIGHMLAKQQNWKVGDRVTLVGEIPPNPSMEFVIAAIPARMDVPWFYFARDYYEESVRRIAPDDSAGVHNFWLKCTSPEAQQWALTEIDKHFQNSEHRTRTEMESTFVAQFAKSGGDWVSMIWNIGQLIVLAAAAVAFNTMSMSFRERTREIAVLRALGFSAARIVRLVLSEGVALGLLGGLIAVGPIYVITRLMNLELPVMEGAVHVKEKTALIAMSVALACGLFAAILPAVLAGRLKVAAALRKVV